MRLFGRGLLPNVGTPNRETIPVWNSRELQNGPCLTDCGNIRGLLVCLPLLGFWLLALRNLATHWSANQIYSYGWLVPLFGAVAAFNRWRTRPSPSVSARLGLWITGAAALAFFPTWVFAQPNLDWSLVGWVMTGLVVVMTLGVIAFVGGWSWFWHFAFPVCFILTAVPWPRFIEVFADSGPNELRHFIYGRTV